MRALLFFSLLTAVTVARADEVMRAADRIAQENLRYVYGSEDVSRGGLDCSAFVRVVFKNSTGIDLPDEADKQLEYVREHGRVWDASSGWTSQTLQPGDLIFYAGPHALPRISQVSHVMMYCGHGVMVGAQGKGRQLNGTETGVGYYPFHIRPPVGLWGESGDRFINHWSVFAYGRLNGVTAPVVPEAVTGVAPPPDPLAAEKDIYTVVRGPVSSLKPWENAPRFDD